MTIQAQTFARRPIARIQFESACNDCQHRRTHPTAKAARRAAWAHETIFGHFAVMADINGWHRP